MHRVSLAAFAAVLAFVPCGASAATADDPCVTVSKADAAKALGTPVVSQKASAAGPSRSCTFRGSAPLHSVVITAFRYDTPADAHARFGPMIAQTAAMGEPALPAPGIGDEAKTIFSTAYARKGSAIYVFNVFGHRGPELTARAATLAKATLAHVH